MNPTSSVSQLSDLGLQSLGFLMCDVERLGLLGQKDNLSAVSKPGEHQYMAAIDIIYSARLLTAGVLVGLPGISPSSPQDLGI